MRITANLLLPLADKTAIGLSLLCTLHCLALPIAIVLLPSIAGLGLDDERFHIWMVIVVIPVSAYALTMGCRKHRKTGVLLTGVVGLVLLCLAPFVGHDLPGESGEKVLTLIAVAIISASHVRNFLLCQKEAACECPN